MFILISFIILLIVGFVYKMIKYFSQTNKIPETNIISESQKKKKQLYDDIINKFVYPNQTTTTLTNSANYSIWTKPTTTYNISKI